MANPAQGLTNDALMNRMNAAITRELSNLMALHVCATCHTTYIPLFAMGQRKCEVHPEPVNFSGSLSSYQMHLPRTNIAGNTALHAKYANAANHHSCCGSVKASMAETYTGSRGIDQRGCTRSDHISNHDWEYINPGFLRDGNEDGVFVKFNPTDLTSNTETAMRHALSERFYVYPMMFIQYLARVYNDEMQRRDDMHGIPPIDLESDMDIISRLLGTEHAHYGNSEEDLHNHSCIRFLMGTKTLIVEMRDAYIFMCKKFNLPSLIVTNRDAVQHHRQQREHIDGTKEEDGGFNMQQAMYDLAPEELDTIRSMNSEKGDGPRNTTNNEFMDIIIKKERQGDGDDDDAMEIDVKHRFFDFVIAPRMSPTNLAQTVGAHISLTNGVVTPSVHPIDRNIFRTYSDKY